MCASGDDSIGRPILLFGNGYPSAPACAPFTLPRAAGVKIGRTAAARRA